MIVTFSCFEKELSEKNLNLLQLRGTCFPNGTASFASSRLNRIQVSEMKMPCIRILNVKLNRGTNRCSPWCEHVRPCLNKMLLIFIFLAQAYFGFIMNSFCCSKLFVCISSFFSCLSEPF